ncbi:MAG: hypothetical protein ABI837_11085, partial [Acidobacteriota bacterium]
MSDRSMAMDGYRTFVAAAIGQQTSPWENLVAQAFLGGTAFLKNVEERIRAGTCSDQHPREQREFRAGTLETVRQVVESMGIVGVWPPGPGSDARALFVLLADRITNATRASIGRHLGMTGQGIGYVIRMGEARSRVDSAFASLVLEGE